MTIEEKAKAYDKAFEKAKKKYNSKYHPSEGPSGVYLNNADLEEIFPSLKESEDESTRKELYVFISSVQHTYLCANNKREKWLAWLEKQKEQKPAEWSEEDETALGDLMWCIEQARKSAKDENDMGNIWLAENWLSNRLKSIQPQPKQKWSEEDKKIIKGLCNLLAAIAKNNYVGCYYAPDLINKIQSLRPSWKPSEEQMKALKASNLYWRGATNVTPPINILELLYNDLQKLM